MTGTRRWRGGLTAWLLLTAWLAAATAGCGVHPGGDALAFVRDGALWTMQADGSDAHRLASGAIVGFGWSPDHHQLVFRTTTEKGVAPPASPLAAAPDALGDLFVTSINGGSALQITQSLGILARSDAWWNPNGNRLLYRQSYPADGGRPGTPTYVESQADQPLGIASKGLLDTASLPVLAADGARVATIDADGNVRLGPPEARGAVVAGGALLTLLGTSGSSRPGRVLWQPRHETLLYPSATSGGVALVLKALGGGARTVATVSALLDMAFSPDGSRLLVRTPQEFSVWNVGQVGGAVYSWTEADPAAVAFWSPDGRFVLIDDTNGSQLANIAARTVTPLRASASVANPHAAQPPFFWHPATGSPWSPDGTRIVFAAARGDTWRGAALPGSGGSQSGGLYVGAITGDGTLGAATLIDPSDDRAASWGYADPSTSFLLPS